MRVSFFFNRVHFVGGIQSTEKTPFVHDIDTHCVQKVSFQLNHHSFCKLLVRNNGISA